MREYSYPVWTSRPAPCSSRSGAVTRRKKVSFIILILCDVLERSPKLTQA
jgi:hypothetical protein